MLPTDCHRAWHSQFNLMPPVNASNTYRWSPFDETLASQVEIAITSVAVSILYWSWIIRQQIDEDWFHCCQIERLLMAMSWIRLVWAFRPCTGEPVQSNRSITRKEKRDKKYFCLFSPSTFAVYRYCYLWTDIPRIGDRRWPHTNVISCKSNADVVVALEWLVGRPIIENKHPIIYNRYLIIMSVCAFYWWTSRPIK